MQTDRSSSTWNFFQRQHEPELWCAVLADDALPRFLLSGEWNFSGHQFGMWDTPPGFNTTAAVQSGRLNGFYLFQLTDTRPRMQRPAAEQRL